MHQGTADSAGHLGLRVIRTEDHQFMSRHGGHELSLSDTIAQGLPQKGQPVSVRRWKASNVSNLWRGVRRVFAARALGIPTVYGSLYAEVLTADGQSFDLGLVSMRVVTDAFVNDVVDHLVAASAFSAYKYHGIGTGSTAESATDTDLVTELTTQYQTDSTRATGTAAEGSSTNIYQTVATNTVDASTAITEHGIFTSATVGAGILMDRSVFSVINLSSGDSIQTTYDLTLSSGG